MRPGRLRYFGRGNGYNQCGRDSGALAARQRLGKSYRFFMSTAQNRKLRSNTCWAFWHIIQRNHYAQTPMKPLALASIILASTFSGCDQRPSTLAPTASDSAAAAPNFVGAWDGGGAADWGDVKIKATKEGYAGTYSGTYNKKLGQFEFRRTQAGGYAGEWWESDKKRHGSFELYSSPDGQLLWIAWEALDGDGRRPEAGMSTWRRKNTWWIWGYGIGLAVPLLIAFGIYRFARRSGLNLRRHVALLALIKSSNEHSSEIERAQQGGCTEPRPVTAVSVRTLLARGR